jgi:foldase protein PrsA
MIGTVAVVVILVCSILFDSLYKKTILNIDGDKYSMEDLNYYFYTVESQYDYYDQMFGGAYWDMTADETTGDTMRDVAKDEAIQNALYTEVLYKEAVAAGYELTAEEKTTVDTSVTSLLDDQMSVEIKAKNKFTKKSLTSLLGKSTLVARYRQDTIDALDIDDATITAGVKYDDYRQYDIETLFISTQTTDADSNSVAMTADEKSAAFDKINALVDTAKTTEDWSTLVPAGVSDLTYKSDSFLVSDTDYSDDFEATMTAMENGDVSSVYEEKDKGYYLVRMVDNNSSESYDTAVAKAISDAEDASFTEVYDTLLAKHTYKINTKALDKYTMGSITLVTTE